MSPDSFVTYLPDRSHVTTFTCPFALQEELRYARDASQFPRDAERPESTDWTVSSNDASCRPTHLGTIERSEEHTSELQSRPHLVCRLLLEKKKETKHN